MTTPLISRAAESSFIEYINVYSNKDQSKKIGIANGIVRLEYFESIMRPTLRASVVFADTGKVVDGKTIVDGLPLVGEEKVEIKFKDNNDVTLTLVMYVNKITPLVNETTKSLVALDLVSRELILNEKVRLNNRFDGKISDHIRRIFTDQNYLSIQKPIDIEETSNNYNFIGNNRKPLYAGVWLSKKAVPNISQAQGNTAGFFLYETSEGFKFKSIDGLLAQEKKKSLIFNQTPDSRGDNIPAGYDGKILEYDVDNRVDVYEKLKIGAFSTRTILFDPFNCYYEVITPNAKDKEAALKLAGKELPVLNPEFNRPGQNKEFSRTTYMLIDKGNLPSGDSQQQIQKSTEQNFDPKNILNQSIMRYNQLFSVQSTITIPGDFSLHAGDAIFIDSKSLEASDEQINTQYGGLYIIADLCHYISPAETYTKLNLVRDSLGRTGNHTSGSIPL